MKTPTKMKLHKKIDSVIKRLAENDIGTKIPIDFSLQLEDLIGYLEYPDVRVMSSGLILQKNASYPPYFQDSFSFYIQIDQSKNVELITVFSISSNKTPGLDSIIEAYTK